MSIKKKQKPLEYFERMLPAYDEYVREKYPESIVLEHGGSEQELEISTCQQNDDMAVDIIGQGENKESESQAIPQLPANFSDFKSLPVSTQSQLLCTEVCDTMQVFEQLQQYTKDTGYHGSFDELYEMASAISEENIRSYKDRKIQMIVDELIRAGATAQNFYQIKTESLAEAFLLVGDTDSSLIPLIIKNILEGKHLPVYGDGSNVRDWLYVEDHCKAIDLVVREGKEGEVYNVGGHNEETNLEIVKLTIATIRKLMTEKPEYRQVLKKKVKGEDGEISVDWINNDLITFVKDRLGHDQRYAIDPTKITNALGWYPETKFEDGIVKTIVWYLENQDWVEEVTSGDYQGYYEKMYGK